MIFVLAGITLGVMTGVRVAVLIIGGGLGSVALHKRIPYMIFFRHAKLYNYLPDNAKRGGSMLINAVSEFLNNHGRKKK